MDSPSLEERSKYLDEVTKKLKGPQFGIRLDILRAIVDDLDSNQRLQEIFGTPVSSKLGVVAAYNDLQIVESKLVKLSDDQKKVFFKELEEILIKHIKKAQETD